MDSSKLLHLFPFKMCATKSLNRFGGRLALVGLVEMTNSGAAALSEVHVVAGVTVSE